jgi:hypothetical protein
MDGRVRGGDDEEAERLDERYGDNWGRMELEFPYLSGHCFEQQIPSFSKFVMLHISLIIYNHILHP